MSRARFFIAEDPPSEPSFLLPLSAEDARHAARVLRVTPGEELEVVAASGGVWCVRVREVTREGVFVDGATALEPIRRPHVALFQGVAKGEKMEAIVRQVVEVGVSEIVPMLTSRTVVRLDERKRIERGERWRRIASAAAKQARREVVPAVLDPVEFDVAAGLLGSYDAAVVLWEDCQGRLLSTAVRSLLTNWDSSLALVIGPEGGLSAEEVGRLEACGAVTATLGPSILRTETAAVVASAIAVSCFYEMEAPADE